MWSQIVSIPTYFQDNAYLFFVLLVWIFFWKGLALWKAARKNAKYWFIAILVLNTLGLLEILYYYIFSERKKKESAVDK